MRMESDGKPALLPPHQLGVLLSLNKKISPAEGVQQNNASTTVPFSRIRSSKCALKSGGSIGKRF
jgi:hypothetical protein